MPQVHDFESMHLERVERENATRIERAGVRYRPADVAPTNAFVAIETAVLVMVAALAMTSIIITAADLDDRTEPATARAPETTHSVTATSRNDVVRHDALFVAR